MKLTKRQKAARKGVRTRQANAASWKRYLEVEKPAREAEVFLVNAQIKRVNGVRVRLSQHAHESNITLRKKSGDMGTLCKVLGTGMLWCVLPDGYAHARNYYAGFWELAA